jgi:hypothetical protein
MRSPNTLSWLSFRWTVGLLPAFLLGSQLCLPAEEADVVVYGGTAGGVMAAVAAARERAQVILLEPGKHLGGMMSGGLGWGDLNRREIIGGYAREYFERVGKVYGQTGMVWHIEPHVAEKVFTDMACEAGVKVRFGRRLKERTGVQVKNGRIERVLTENGEDYRAKTFIDATYEGDLMAWAGVRYRVGRESREEYDEPGAGVRRLVPSGVPGSAYDSHGLLPLVHDGTPGVFGSGDNKVQSYNFRLCLTRNRTNLVRVAKPAKYDPRDYELLARYLAGINSPRLADVLTISVLPKGKTDINNGCTVSTDLPNANWGYPDGSYAERARIWERHRNYTSGLLWFLGNDPRVPEKLRAEMLQWGYAKDEFTDNDNFPWQLYIREGRRMLGSYVMTEKDARHQNQKEDSIGMGSYMLDCHPVQRVRVGNNDYANEGYIGSGNRILPYEIPYRILTPRKEECSNLLVPVCLSASHVAWSSLRMEPQFLICGQAAGVAAAMATRAGSAVQDVPAAQLREKLLAQKQILKWKLPGLIDPQTLAGTVVDNERAKFSGLWKTGNQVGPLVGTSFHFARGRQESLRARYTPELKPGRYELRMFFAPYPEAAGRRASNVVVTVQHAKGQSTVKVDQQKDLPDGGYPLGVYEFAGKGGSWAEINGESTDGLVIADAIQWIPLNQQ